MGVVQPVRRDRKREATARGVLVTLIVLATLLLALVVAPFWKALFLACVLAGALHPWYERLTARLRGHRQLAAAVVTVIVTAMLVIPVALLALKLATEAVNAVQYVTETLRSEGVAGLIADLPPQMQPAARSLIERLPKGGQEQMAQLPGSQAAAAVGGVLQATSSAVFQTAMMLIAFFFLLTDGPRLLDWIAENAPMPAPQVRGLFAEFRQVSVSVLVSSTATALAQALAALVGFLFAGVPSALFFFALTFIMAFVPAVGGGGTTVAVAGFVLLTGRPGAALFLALWGMIVVGLADNALKPLLMKSSVQLHGALIFFALLGGLAFFGAVGLIAGPVILVFFLAVVRMSRRDYSAAG